MRRVFERSKRSLGQRKPFDSYSALDQLKGAESRAGGSCQLRNGNVHTTAPREIHREFVEICEEENKYMAKQGAKQSTIQTISTVCKIPSF